MCAISYKLGRITEKTEVVNGITTTYGYGYDLAGRLQTVRENGVLVRTYGFDSNSNRISLASAGGTLTGTADAQDRLLSYGPNAYSYAPNGEPTTRTKANSTRNFNYDEMGNLTALSEGSLQLNYQFDAQGRRIQRSKNGQLTHRWLYLDQLRIAAELNADGSLKQQFAYGEKLNVPSLILRKGQNQTEAYRIVSDHVGSVRLVVKVSDGIIVQRMRYDEYGQVLEDTNPGFQPFGYAGGLYDPDSGLVRFGARDYDAEIGRWLAKDPVRFFGGISFYQYSYSDPINYFDAAGESPTIAIGRAARVGWEIGTFFNRYLQPRIADALDWAFSQNGEDLDRNPGDDKLLSKGEIDLLKRNGIVPHDLKPDSKFDLYKDKLGRIFCRKKAGGDSGGEDTGMNINGF